MFTSQEASDWRLFMARQQAGGGLPAGFQLLFQRVNVPGARGDGARSWGASSACLATDDETQVPHHGAERATHHLSRSSTADRASPR